MLMDPWITRIRTQVPAFKTVAGAAEFGAAQAQLVTTPSAFVVPSREAGSDDLLSGITHQMVSSSIAVIIAVRNVRDMRGGAAVDELEPMRLSVRQALFGWVPEADYWPTIFRGGNLLSLDDQVLWWQDEYETKYHLDKLDA